MVLEIDKVKDMIEFDYPLHGRDMILTSVEEVNAGNVVSVLGKAIGAHSKNKREIEYLHQYVQGIQPILKRIKRERPEICNKIIINRANEIVAFKVANFIGSPLQYVSRGSQKSLPKKLDRLNAFLLAENKASKDMSLAFWMFTCGLGYRFVGNDKWNKSEKELKQNGEAPFELYNPDPKHTFCIYRNDITKKKLAAVHFVTDSEGHPTYTVYTPDDVFEITGAGTDGLEILSRQKNAVGMIPIVEYACNELRMGAFEAVISLLDAINLTESNRLDAVEQFVQAFLVIKNFDMKGDDINELKRKGAIVLPPNQMVGGADPDIKYLNEQLDQSQTQTLVDDMYQTVLQIVGIPHQGNANTSDSSNNGAVIMKNGWWNAEARAKETVGMWETSETEQLKIMLQICREAVGLDISVTDIQMKFGRTGYEDKLTKVQSFTMLTDAGCPPRQAFTISNTVDDPESAALEYEAYQAEKEAEMQKQLEQAQANADKHSEETIVTENADRVSAESTDSEQSKGEQA